MRIDAKLNIVVEVETDAGSIFVHATPLSRDVFERYFMVLGRAFAGIMSGGLSLVSGPRVAALMLKKVAQESGEWEGPGGVETGLIAEIRRTAMAVTPGPSGWLSMPLESASHRELISADDLSEVENLLAFFICVSCMVRKSELAYILGKMSMWGARVTLLNSTDFVASLSQSTEEQTFLPTEKLSSVPH